MMDHETLGGRIPKGERRVRFADSMGLELVSIFLTDLFVLASHTPYTNYHEHRKPPSSRLSSTLQAIQYNHDHHHNNHQHHQSKSNLSNSARPSMQGHNNFISSTTTTTTTTTNTINNNNNNNSIHNNHNNHYGSGYHSNGGSGGGSGGGSSRSNSYHSELTSTKQFHQQQAPARTSAAAAAAQAAALLKQSFSPSPAAAAARLSAPLQAIEFACEFTQPVSLISFKERVKLKRVHLESCYINTTAGHVSLTCNIRVLNVSYDKSVSVRYTTDEWASHADSLASYKPGTSDGWSDQFSSSVSIINKLQPGQRIIFAVRFLSGGQSFWDNNGGLNYSVKSKG